MSYIEFGEPLELPFMEDSAEDRFRAFHKLNPAVFDELVVLADDLLQRGYKRGGMKMLFEVLRWQRMMRTSDPSSEFKLNNNYTSHYARLLADIHPRFEGFFETRRLRSGPPRIR